MAIGILLAMFATRLMSSLLYTTSPRDPSVYGFVVACIALVSLVAPYRLLYKNEFERVNWKNTSCYITGEHASDALLFCPDLQPVRNVVAPKTTIQRVGRPESIFTRFGPAAKR